MLDAHGELMNSSRRDRTGIPARTSLGHMPAGHAWTFDHIVTAVFADMLRRSIPQYGVMRSAVFELGARFVQPGTQIVDLGCARGDALMPFVTTFAASNTYVAVDLSAPMLDAAREQFRGEIEDGIVRVMSLDLRTDYPPGDSSLTLCVLTLQFVPVEDRRRILRTVYEKTVLGGACILVEKVLGADAELDLTMVDLYHRMKARHGYSVEEIESKRRALQGVLVPLTARRNEEMLAEAGFNQIDCFWRWMNFAGWVALKRPTSFPRA